LLEALPPPLSGEQLMTVLEVHPDFDLRTSKSAQPHVRKYDVELLEGLYFPPSIAVQYAGNVDMLLRKGYRHRNPLSQENVQYMYNLQNLMKSQGAARGTLSGMATLKGLSGMGKSRLTRTVLSMFPQTILHENYNGVPYHFTQLVWLSVEAPIAGSMKGFMLSLFTALDEALGLTGTSQSYAADISSKESYSNLMTRFVQIAATHSLGLLHVDDIQRIAESSSDKEHVMQLMIRLANVAGFGILFTGTEDISKIIRSMGGRKSKNQDTFAQQFEVTRRMMNEGFSEIERPRSADDAFFVQLTKKLLAYQWLDEPMLCSGEVLQTLYDMTAGIPAILVYLHKAAQIYALTYQERALTLQHYKDVYTTSLAPLEPLVRRLRMGLIDNESFGNEFERLNSSLQIV
jgi:hypothetical protein